MQFSQGQKRSWIFMTSQAQGKVSAAAEVPWAHLRFPPFPQTALKVLESVENENVSMRQFSDLISSDPALSCEVLIIANSALLAQRHRVTSILQAIALLGTRTLKGVCLTVGVRAFLGKSMSYPSLRAIWRHSLATALISEQLADPSLVDKGTAYTAGVVHEIGRFALSVLRPKEYAELLQHHRGSAITILESERELFGFDSREAGRHLIADWKLPSEFEALLRQPEPESDYQDDLWRLDDVIRVSCHLADAAGFTIFPGCEVTPYADLLERIPVRKRCLLYADVDRLVADIGSRLHAIEAL
jgi:HD-like signal output (HDOD) protein